MIKDPTRETIAGLTDTDLAQRYQNTFIYYRGQTRFCLGINRESISLFIPPNQAKKEEKEGAGEELPNAPLRGHLLSVVEARYFLNFLVTPAFWNTMPTTLMNLKMWCRRTTTPGSVTHSLFKLISSQDDLNSFAEKVESLAPTNLLAQRWDQYNEHAQTDWANHVQQGATRLTNFQVLIDWIISWASIRNSALNEDAYNNVWRDYSHPRGGIEGAFKKKSELLEFNPSELSIERPRSGWHGGDESNFFLSYSTRKQYQRGISLNNTTWYTVGNDGFLSTYNSAANFDRSCKMLDSAYKGVARRRVQMAQEELMEQLDKVNSIRLSSSLLASKRGIYYKATPIVVFQKKEMILTRPIFKQELEEVLINPSFKLSTG